VPAAVLFEASVMIRSRSGGSTVSTNIVAYGTIA
jgi:hypothetical protein